MSVLTIWVQFVQITNNYGLKLGTAHYYVTMIPQCCNYYAYQYFMYFRLLIFELSNTVSVLSRLTCIALYSFILKIPDNGPPLPKHVGV